jgi:hypothetical protein
MTISFQLSMVSSKGPQCRFQHDPLELATDN